MRAGSAARIAGRVMAGVGACRPVLTILRMNVTSQPKMALDNRFAAVAAVASMKVIGLRPGKQGTSQSLSTDGPRL